MQSEQDVFPCVGFVVSGGHTNLYRCRSASDFELLGSTIDDAAGEAFDKVAKILGLSYPGGPSIQQLAESGDAGAISLPRPFLNQPRLEFSFSGLKTAVMYQAFGNPGSGKPVPELTEQRKADLAASFQAAVVDVLVGKCAQAIEQTGYRTLCVGGGVACNRPFREKLTKMTASRGIRLEMAAPEYCTDNAAMGAIAWTLLNDGRTAELDLDVRPGLVRQNG
jgi:N6-L-threonylcarbamoyladenine synthase